MRRHNETDDFSVALVVGGFLSSGGMVDRKLDPCGCGCQRE